MIYIFIYIYIYRQYKLALIYHKIGRPSSGTILGGTNNHNSLLTEPNSQKVACVRALNAYLVAGMLNSDHRCVVSCDLSLLCHVDLLPLLLNEIQALLVHVTPGEWDKCLVLFAMFIQKAFFYWQSNLLHHITHQTVSRNTQMMWNGTISIWTKRIVFQ